jgi:uncharacterized protein GlcG (DUF336 family)
MLIKLCIIAACTAAACAANNAPTNFLQERNIPLNLALEIAQGAVKACADQKYSVSAAIVDRGGVLKTLIRADGAAIHTPGAAQRKAYTSASSRTATSDMARTIQQNPGAAQLVAVDGFLVLAGGVPIKVGNETIGAVGVGGAPGGDIDEACANAALKQVAHKLK